MSSNTSFNSDLSAYLANNNSMSTMSTNAGRKKSAKKDVAAIDKKNEEAVRKANKDREILRRENEKLRKQMDEQNRKFEEAERNRELNAMKEKIAERERELNDMRQQKTKTKCWC